MLFNKKKEKDKDQVKDLGKVGGSSGDTMAALRPKLLEFIPKQKKLQMRLSSDL